MDFTIQYNDVLKEREIALFTASAQEPIGGFRSNCGTYADRTEADNKCDDLLKNGYKFPQVSITWVSETRYRKKWQSKFGPLPPCDQ